MTPKRISHWLGERPLGFGADAEGKAPVDDLLQMAVGARWLKETVLASSSDEATGTSSISVSIEGPWGSGKTSFVYLFKQALFKDIQDGTLPVWIDFNAWQCSGIGAGPWEAIAYRIGEALYRRVHAEACRIHRDKSVSEKKIVVGSPRRRGLTVPIDVAELADERLAWQEVARILSEKIAKEDWHPCLKLFADAPTKINGRGGGWGGVAMEIGLGATGVAAGLAAGPVGWGAALTGSGQALNTIQKATKARAEAKKSLQRLEGLPWGVDTREFVEHLGLLAEVLVPHSSQFRLIVLMDDVSRLPPGDLLKILDALSYLRELPRTLVLLTMDAEGLAQLEAEMPAHFLGRSERFVSKIVHTRYRLSPVDNAALARFGNQFFSDLGISSAFAPGIETNPIRRLLAGGVQTPRGMKRSLAWLWGRIVTDGPLLEWCRRVPSHPDLAIVLSVLVDIHLFTEGLINGEEIDKRVRTARDALLHFSCQPWDGQTWPDKGGARPFSPKEAPLVAWIRYLQLSFFTGGRPDPQRLETPKVVWRRWSEDWPFGRCEVWKAPTEGDINDIVQGENISDLLTLVEDLEKLLEIRWISNISAAARHVWLGADEPAPVTFQDTINRWSDADALTQVAMSRRVSRKTETAARMLLRIFHPDTASRVDADGELLKAGLDAATNGNGERLFSWIVKLAETLHLRGAKS